MAEALRGHVLSHWSKLIEDFQMPSLDFYTRVDQAIKRRQISETNTYRVLWKEAGIFSAQREYLRIERGEHVFDVCAAPFGTGFFFSWWFAQTRSPLGWFYGFVVVFLTAVINSLPGLLFFPFREFLRPETPGEGVVFIVVGLVFSLLWFLFAFLVATWLTALFFGVRAILEIPVLGRFCNWLFRPVTYYRLDTALMFQKSVHNAVMEVIDELTTAKGLRALSQEDRKPILESFLNRAA